MANDRWLFVVDGLRIAIQRQRVLEVDEHKGRVSRRRGLGLSTWPLQDSGFVCGFSAVVWLLRLLRAERMRNVERPSDNGHGTVNRSNAKRGIS